MESLINLKYIVNALVFSVIGIIILAIAMYLFDKLTPNKLWDEIVHKQNVALAIAAAAVIIGMSLIIAFSIHG
jgi:uncharacterized membrane protein YjfL (UPF0719 family)